MYIVPKTHRFKFVLPSFFFESFHYPSPSNIPPFGLMVSIVLNCVIQAKQHHQQKEEKKEDAIIIFLLLLLLLLS